jgi:hypothetical protein
MPEKGIRNNNKKNKKKKVMSRHHTAGQNHNQTMTNKRSENVTKFKNFGARVKNQNCIH